MTHDAVILSAVRTPFGRYICILGVILMPLDPQVAAYLQASENTDGASDPEPSLDELRHQSELNALKEAGEPEIVASVTDYRIPGPADDIPVRIYTPEGTGPFPVLVYFHPGGWVMGSIAASDPVCRALAKHTPCMV